MPDPATLDEYNKRFNEGTLSSVAGVGAGVTVTMPCPFCAAPNWLKASILDVEGAMTKGATCSECARSGRAIMSHDATGNSIGFEFVQTGGDDPPSYLPPMRRLEG